MRKCKWLHKIKECNCIKSNSLQVHFICKITTTPSKDYKCHVILSIQLDNIIYINSSQAHIQQSSFHTSYAMLMN